MIDPLLPIRLEGGDVFLSGRAVAIKNWVPMMGVH